MNLVKVFAAIDAYWRKMQAPGAQSIWTRRQCMYDFNLSAEENDIFKRAVVEVAS
jgi:hypothetical protein